MADNKFRIKIGELWNSDQGTKFTYEFDEKAKIEEIDLEGHLKFNLELIKMKDSILVLLKGLECKVKGKCDRCLDEYLQDIYIEETSREFVTPDLQGRKAEGYTPMEQFLIDLKDLTIDLTEMLRQEILLQFPYVQVCSESCEGLCTECGEKLNSPGHKKRKHQSIKTEEENKPFKDLKALFEGKSNK